MVYDGDYAIVSIDDLHSFKILNRFSSFIAHRAHTTPRTVVHQMMCSHDLC